MATLPDPPAKKVLQSIKALLHVFAAGTKMWRVYFRAGPHPTTWDQFRQFGPIGARFDHHTPPRRMQKRAIIYLASHPITCLAEVFQQTRLIDRRRHEPWLVGFALIRDVVLLDLAGLWQTQAGASMAINTGSRAKARNWSRAIHAAYPNVEGLYYSSSMYANEPAAALYERTKDAFPSTPLFNRGIGDPVLDIPLRNAAFSLSYGLF